MQKNHNDGNQIQCKSWNEYFNLNKFDVIDNNPPVYFDDQNTFHNPNNLSIKFLPSNTPIHTYIQDTSDIIILVNFTSSNNGLFVYSFLPYGRNQPLGIPVSDKIHNYANIILNKLALIQFGFIHIRRGDFLDNKKLAPPYGTRPYTSPPFVSNFIKNKFSTNYSIIISNNEVEFQNQIKMLLPNFKIYIEDDLWRYLPNNITFDNYDKYIILNEIANRCNVNIGTYGYIRLGKKYDYTLYHHFTNTNTI